MEASQLRTAEAPRVVDAENQPGWCSWHLVGILAAIRRAGSLKWRDAEENLLDDFCRAGLAGGSHIAILVGSGRNATDRLRELVVRLSQRLVLNCFVPRADSVHFQSVARSISEDPSHCC
jgi:hypothetical protein